MKKSILKAGIIVSFFMLCGCATPPQTQHLLNSPPPHLPASANINNLPFYPQQAYYCGPTTLAEIFEFNGIKLSPEEIAPQLFIPGRKGSLQLEMIAAIRQQGLLAYSERSHLEQLITLVNLNIPIIVLQNLGLDWYPLWHYAVVKGYDLNTQEIILHSADTANRRVDLALFERTWQRANFWSVIALPTQHSLKELNAFNYLKAAQDLLLVGQTHAGIAHLEKATQLWPEQWLSYFLLGNYYLTHDITRSVNWFEQGLPLALTETNYLNNYAYALFKNNQKHLAKTMIEQALKLAPNDANLLDTQAEIVGFISQ
ncbi:PA2778 family cysteine peptidase [Thalassotalea agariperforans]